MILSVSTYPHADDSVERKDTELIDDIATPVSADAADDEGVSGDTDAASFTVVSKNSV